MNFAIYCEYSDNNNQIYTGYFYGNSLASIFASIKATNQFKHIDNYIIYKYNGSVIFNPTPIVQPI